MTAIRKAACGRSAVPVAGRSVPGHAGRLAAEIRRPEDHRVGHRPFPRTHGAHRPRPV